MRDFRNPRYKVLRDREECIECDLCVRQCANEVHYRDEKTGALRADSMKCVTGAISRTSPMMVVFSIFAAIKNDLLCILCLYYTQPCQTLQQEKSTPGPTGVPGADEGGKNVT